MDKPFPRTERFKKYRVKKGNREYMTCTLYVLCLQEFDSCQNSNAKLHLTTKLDHFEWSYFTDWMFHKNTCFPHICLKWYSKLNLKTLFNRNEKKSPTILFESWMKCHSQKQNFLDPKLFVISYCFVPFRLFHQQNNSLY